MMYLLTKYVMTNIGLTQEILPQRTNVFMEVNQANLYKDWSHVSDV